MLNTKEPCGDTLERGIHDSDKDVSRNVTAVEEKNKKGSKTRKQLI